MDLSYFIVLLSGAVICTTLFALLLKKDGLKSACALLALPLSAVLALACAKAGYFLLLFDREWPQYGLGGLLRFSPGELSFFCGCAGAVLGAALAGKIAGQPVKRTLDLFAPCGALMAAFVRGAEYFVTGMNLPSQEIESEFFRRFPFAVTNEYEEWYAALFLLSALFALAVCIVFLLRKKERRIPGLRLERAAFYLCLPQIFMESLRSDSITWGFVRCEQVLCAVCLLLLLARSCLAAREKGFFKTWWPVLADVACVGLLIFIEFNLDRDYIPLSRTGNYAAMWAVLLGIAACEVFCTRRRLQRAER